MSQTVVYLNRGTRCYLRLLTSIFSLRKYYRGTVVLLQEGDLIPAVKAVLSELCVEVRTISDSEDSILVRKSSIWRDLYEEEVMYLDSDTIIQSPIDEFFSWIKKYGFVTCWFAGWFTTDFPVRTRIEEWNLLAPHLVQSALKYRKAINSGVLGWSKGASILREYEELTRKGAAAGHNRLVVDEVALQLLIPYHSHYLAPQCWNTSAVYGNINNAKIIHYHGRKHCSIGSERCFPWKQSYFDLLATFPEYISDLQKHWGDTRFDNFSLNFKRRRTNVTVVVTASNDDDTKIETNLRAWLRINGISSQQFIIFASGLKYYRELRFLEKINNVKVVRCDFKTESKAETEFLPSNFMAGIIKHVRTPYWMWLRICQPPAREWWEWPNYEIYSAMGSNWGLTFPNRMSQIASDSEMLLEKACFNYLYDPLDVWNVNGLHKGNEPPRNTNFSFKIEHIRFTYILHSLFNLTPRKADSLHVDRLLTWYKSIYFK